MAKKEGKIRRKSRKNWGKTSRRRKILCIFLLPLLSGKYVFRFPHIIQKRGLLYLKIKTFSVSHFSEICDLCEESWCWRNNGEIGDLKNSVTIFYLFFPEPTVITHHLRHCSASPQLHPIYWHWKIFAPATLIVCLTGYISTISLMWGS